MTTLKNVLEQQQFSNLSLLTSDKTLDHIVESVEISETPDVSQYIPENVFLLTTAMVYKDNPIDLIHFIQSLKEAKAAGIGIKLGRFLTEIPQEVVDYAESIDFALLTIPMVIPLGSVLHQMLGYINDRKEELLMSAIEIQKRFSQLLINDGDVLQFLKLLHSIINVPVMLLNPFFDIEAGSNAMLTKLQYAHNLCQTANQQYKANKSENSYTFVVPGDEKEYGEVSMYPIRLSKETPYFLVVLNASKMPYPLATVVIEQAIMTLSFILFKNQKLTEYVQDRESGHFSHFVRAQRDRNLSGKMLLQLGERFNLKLSTHYQVVCCRVVDLDKNSLIEQKTQIHLLSNWMHEQLKETMPNVRVFHNASHQYIIIFIQDNLEQLENLDDILIRLSQQLTEKLDITLNFCLGKSYDKMEKIHASMTEAKLTHEKALTLKKYPVISKYYDDDTHNIFKLFDQFNRDKVDYFCNAILKELAFPTEEYYLELRHTLKVYLDHQCEITKTAKTLFLHRNTVKYRIERCEELLGEEIDNPKVNLNYRIALELSENDVTN